MIILGEGHTSTVYCIETNNIKMVQKTIKKKEDYIIEKNNLNILDNIHEIPKHLMVKVLGTCDESNSILFQYNECTTLRQWKLEVYGKLNRLESINMFLNVASTALTLLTYLHKNNVYHGDLKDDNILVLKDGQIKIIDFGMLETNTYDQMIQKNNDLKGLKKALYIKTSSPLYDDFLKIFPSRETDISIIEATDLLAYLETVKNNIIEDFVNIKLDYSNAYNDVEKSKISEVLLLRMPIATKKQ